MRGPVLVFLSLLGLLPAALPARTFAQSASAEAGAPSTNGLPGALRVGAASPAEAGSLHVAAGLEFFSQPGFIVEGRNHRRTGTSTAIGWSPLSALSLSAVVLSATNHDSSTNPFFIAAYGDVDASVRLAGDLVRRDRFAISAGARAGVRLMQGDAPGARIAESASPYARGLVSIETGPARISADAGYLSDNSSNLIDTAFEPDAGQRYAYGISDYDAVVGGIALDFPGARIGPFAETSFRADLGADGDPSVVATGGVKLWSERRRMSLLLGADVGLLGTELEEGRLRTPDWNLVAGLSVGFGARGGGTTRPGPGGTRNPRAGAKGAESSYLLADGTLGGRVRGKVLIAGSNNPVVGAIVEIKSANKSAKTGLDGKFDFPAIPLGPVEVTVRHPRYLAHTRTALVSEAQITTVALGLLPAPKVPAVAMLRGRVTGAGGEAVPGVTLIVRTAEKVIKLVPAADGSFRTEMPAGSFAISASATGFETITQAGSTNVRETREIALTLVRPPPPAKLSGRVVNVNKAPLAATVTVTGAQDRNAALTTDAKGAFSTALPAGTYQVNVEAAGMAPQTMTVTLDSAKPATLNVTMKKAR